MHLPPLMVALLLAAAFLVAEVSAAISQVLSPSKVYVDDSGRYQDFVVAINMRLEDPSLEEGYLNNVKNEISNLSSAIYDTLGLRFDKVTIIVPSHWSAARYTSGYNESPESADMLVQPINDGVAYTQHIQGCGHQALRTVLNEKYLRPNRAKGVKTKYLLHQWMHSRYGVFDEFPLTDDSALDVDKQKFYHSSQGTIEANRCSGLLETSTDCDITEETSYADIETSRYLPKRQCLFSLKPPSEPVPSLMSNYTLDNITLLCNESTHNREAPNIHNRLCGGLSVEEVIRGHPDLVKLKEMAGPLLAYQPPEFSERILPRTRTVVFVLDTSRSMNGSRIYLAKQAIASMIANILEDGVKILIVKFDQNAAQLFPSDDQHLVELNSKETRDNAISSLNNIQTGDHTSIGAGLEFAFGRLETEYDGAATGAFFILLTDGVDTKNKDLTPKMFTKSKQEGFFIDTILLGNEADDRIAKLSQAADLQVFTATDYSSDLIDAFTEMITSRQNFTHQAIQIYSEYERIETNDRKSGHFVIEEDLSELAEITFYWNVTAQPYLSFRVERLGLNGKVVLDTNSRNHSLGYLTLALKDMTAPDAEDSFTFRYIITNTHPSSPLHATVTVNTRVPSQTSSSRRRRSSSDDVEYEQSYSMNAYVRSETNFTFSKDGHGPEVTIHAYLQPGSTRKLPENVLATVTVNELGTKQTTDFTIELYDTGVGADTIREDGMFSAYFTDFQSYNATYYVRVRAKGEGFMRYASTGYFIVYVKPDANVSTVLPPTPISDLEVMASTPTQITLTFTAPGSDLDSGKASVYKVWWADSYHNLMNGTKPSSYSHMYKLKEAPRPSHNKERVTAPLPKLYFEFNTTLWLAMTSEDEYGVESNISNIVSARYMSEVALMKKVSPIIEEPDIAFYIIVGVTGLLLIIIIIILVILCLRVRRHRRRAANSTKEWHSGSKSGDPEDWKVSGADDTQEDPQDSELPEYKDVYYEVGQYRGTSRLSKLVAIKRAVSIKFSTKRKSHKSPAPPPPPPQIQAKPAPHPLGNIPTGGRGLSKKPLVIDMTNMLEDVTVGETYAQGLVCENTSPQTHRKDFNHPK